MDTRSELPLFRAQALDEVTSRLGAPVKLLGLPGWLLTLFLVLLLVSAAVFAMTTRYAHKETVTGQVTPVDGSLRVIAARAGTAERVLVSEGQRVRAGQELIAVSSAPKLELGDSLSERLQQNQQLQLTTAQLQAQARVDQIQRQLDEVNEHRHGVQTDLEKLREARRLQESRISIQQQMTASAQALGDQGMLSALGVRAREDELLAAKQTLAALERETAQQTSLVSQLTAQAARLSAEVRMAQSEAQNMQAQLAERRMTSEASYSDHLTAPIDGVVTALQARKGGPVLPNQTLAVLIPLDVARDRSAMEVELWAPSRAIGMVRTGAPVLIMYDAFPYQTFGVAHGTVREVANAPVMPGELPVPIDAKEQLYRIRVSLERAELQAYGRSWPLSPGMRLSADLILEERTLIQWLLDPVLATHQRI